MVLFGCPLWIMLAWLFVLGAVVGSFLNVCIHRFPRHERLADQWRALGGAPSHCPYCRQRIRWHDNVPIIGWLMLRGRCRRCRHRIPFRYPLVELLAAVLFAAVYWHQIPSGFGATIAEGGLSWRYGPQGVAGSIWSSDQAILHWRYVLHMVLVSSLVVATFIDFKHKIIPDGSTVPAIVAGLVSNWAIGRVYLVPVWYQSPSLLNSFSYALETSGLLPDWLAGTLSGPAVPGWIARYPHTHGLLVSLAGFVVGGGAVWAVRVVGHWALRQEAMGFGDVILMAAIGACLGWQPVVIVFFIAPVCALAVVLISWLVRREREIPYGPYLSLATLILLLGWQSIWPVAERFFSLGPLVPVLAAITVSMLAACLMLMQGVKRLLGIPLYPDQWDEEWTSADQLAYFANQQAALDDWDCDKDRWPGSAAARGNVFEHHWRCDCSGSSNRLWQHRH